MQKIAVFPGTFDPFTNGHYDIVKKGLLLFDQIIVAIGHNAGKKHLFPLDKRLEWIKKVYKNEPRVHADTYQGLTSEFCKKREATFLLRGLRTINDFEYEKQIARVNEHLNSDLLNVFLISDESVSSVSSTIVRDLILYNGDYQRFIPSEIKIDVEPLQSQDTKGKRR
ncbi:MAG: pantetheine-phosphate adenylyltransferase [Flavobacteriales bacterium]|nr:pantetheine-phosphate adenylyltransferase [Flavobacteriales bacterium]